MAKITIENLRHIKKLEFDIPKQGVWLLTGANGTGKTSLLACLRRLAYAQAFPVHFPSSRLSEQLDSYSGASVKYDTPGGAVKYTYVNTRWNPRPKTNSGVLQTVGFPEVIYVAANADRIEPRKEDFSPARMRPASAGLINAANRIFCTDKFSHLKTINVRKGIGSQAFMLEVPTLPKQKKRYFSEKNLSLGELCILKLLRMLIDCPKGSLVLIDELELALHPSAQTELLQYLQSISDDKSLTVVVSTHSSTIIKQAPRSKILLLQADQDGNVSCIANCFPSFVLGTLAYAEESASDVLLYVEDDSARVIVEQLVRRFIADQFKHESLVPSVQVVPVGGFVNVLRFFVRQKPLLPSVTRAFVVLDADAEESLDNAQVADIVEIYKNKRDSISFLPYTPEVGLVSYMNEEHKPMLKFLREHYSHNTLVLRLVDIGKPPGPDVLKPRDECKKIVDEVCKKISAQLPNSSINDVRSTLFKLLAEHTFKTNRAVVMQQFGPIIKGH